LVDSFARLKHVADDHGPLLDQATLAAFMESGAFYTHLRRCRRTYGERQHYFLEESRRQGLPLRFPVTDGGMNLTGFLPEGTDDCAWNDGFRTQGLDIAPLSRYAVEDGRPGMLFGFTAFDQAAIRSGLGRVARVFDGR
jgi:GntR family transcriptional regulator/MocR family aminotransferase